MTCKSSSKPRPGVDGPAPQVACFRAWAPAMAPAIGWPAAPQSCDLAATAQPISDGGRLFHCPFGNAETQNHSRALQLARRRRLHTTSPVLACWPWLLPMIPAQHQAIGHQSLRPWRPQWSRSVPSSRIHPKAACCAVDRLVGPLCWPAQLAGRSSRRGASPA